MGWSIRPQDAAAAVCKYSNLLSPLRRWRAYEHLRWYAPDGKRIWRQMVSGTHEFMFYGAHGELLGTYTDSYGRAPLQYRKT